MRTDTRRIWFGISGEIRRRGGRILTSMTRGTHQVVELNHTVDVKLWCDEDAILIDNSSVTKRAVFDLRMWESGRKAMTTSTGLLCRSWARPADLHLAVTPCVRARAGERMVEWVRAARGCE